MPEHTEIEYQITLLHTHRQTLQHYIRQAAVQGEGNIPPAIYHGINNCCKSIQSIKSTLRNWNISVEDYPEDEFEFSKLYETEPASPKKQNSRSRRRNNSMLSQIDDGINLPSFGDIFTGKIVDMDEDLILVEVPGLNPQHVPGVIRSENIGGKRYRVGNSARVEVIAVKQTKTGKIAIELCPVFTGR